MFKSLCLSLGLLAALPAAAQTLSATDPEGIAEAIRRGGFEVGTAQSNSGDPALIAVHSQVRFQVFFLGCEEAKNCKHLLFNAQYGTEEPVSPEQVNAWMTTNAMGAVSYDPAEGVSRLRYFLTTVGGVDTSTFTETLYLWRIANQSWLRTIVSTPDE